MRRVKVTRKYQVTIPKDIAESVGIRVGDTVVVSVSGGRLVLEKINVIDELEGALEPAGRRVRGLAEELDKERRGSGRG
ncbi:MAG TPA: AbrB/MazE/SpoVT family DNA-binding domain-containing protein [Candidatus Caldiarchaeum subterraneum]|uniref:AbrB/MazE/SpoVT family DNA-binding domain-containing protein n=1 Tax=Caldiarchaeum subterraneum TaxID=311458 RepID=A0A833A554_CALS0|nr:AbrB/MazE/SpoVT family DNA-binding domain-containing protein [Aigarchaeota archaeon]HIQ30228.1 AbrB/MazE/SpoVT family DNA-binding domain-containing protein [Candidatus Caldarchaeum subterraneum]